MTSHTPGPWEVNYGNTIGHIKSVAEHPKGMTPTVCRFDRELIASVTISEDEALANANLMAAAPDMLAALQSLNAIVDFREPFSIGDIAIDDVSGINEACQRCLAAIAKAEGKLC